MLSYSDKRTFKDAVAALNSLPSNEQVLAKIRSSGVDSGPLQLEENVEYLQRIGYDVSELNKLNVIHITGTKGKGSTSAFTSSILSTLAPTAKVGLYTSPHLVSVAERIRINGVPISEEKFSMYFWQVWDRFEANPTVKRDWTTQFPAYFRFLTFMALHVFASEKVDATILEVGIGGLYDTTNVVPAPITTGITTLGIDHTPVLGNTIQQIAWQKGGIYKENVPALSVVQPFEESTPVLQKCATDAKASGFKIIPLNPETSSITLGLAGEHQRVNASLAVALVESFLSGRLPNDSPFKSVSPFSSALELPSSIVRGLENARWPGRCQISKDPHNKKLQYFLDGAHTVDSLSVCGTWFSQTSHSDNRTLVFNCTSGRSGEALLGSLIESMRDVEFDTVIFCTNAVHKSDWSSDVTVQNELKEAWITLGNDESRVSIFTNIEEALGTIRSTEGDVLVTGSLHLVGGFIEVAGIPL